MLGQRQKADILARRLQDDMEMKKGKNNE